MSGTTSASITLPSSLLRTHAPILIPPNTSVSPRISGLCRLLSAPAGRRTFPALSLRIFLCVLGPLPRLLSWCIYPFLPTRRRPSQRYDPVGAWQRPYYSNFSMELLSGLQSFSNVQARRFARHPDCSYRSTFSGTEQPWLLRPSISRLVTSPCPGYTNRPFRATDGKRTFTSQDSQTCRLLP